MSSSCSLVLIIFEQIFSLSDRSAWDGAVTQLEEYIYASNVATNCGQLRVMVVHQLLDEACDYECVASVVTNRVRYQHSSRPIQVHSLPKSCGSS